MLCVHAVSVIYCETPILKQSPTQTRHTQSTLANGADWDEWGAGAGQRRCGGEWCNRVFLIPCQFNQWKSIRIKRWTHIRGCRHSWSMRLMKKWYVQEHRHVQTQWHVRPSKHARVAKLYNCNCCKILRRKLVFFVTQKIENEMFLQGR